MCKNYINQLQKDCNILKRIFNKTLTWYKILYWFTVIITGIILGCLISIPLIMKSYYNNYMFLLYIPIAFIIHIYMYYANKIYNKLSNKIFKLINNDKKYNS